MGTISGTSGDDTITGGAGNDILIGEGGTDTVVVDTPSFILANGALYVASASGGVDELRSIERVATSTGMLTIAAAADGDVLVNSTTYDRQMTPSVGSLANGGYVVAWHSYQDGSYYGIYAQRYDANGVPQGGEVRVNTTTAGTQLSPIVEGLSGGGYVITWWSDPLGWNSPGADVLGQRYDASGVPQGGEMLINTTTASSQYQSAVSALAGGGFVVTWTSYGQDGSGRGVYGQRFDAGGQRQGVEFRVNTTTLSDQQGSTVAGLNGGGFVVAWTSQGQDGSGDGIYAQRYSANGTPQGVETHVSTYTLYTQHQPAVAALSNGGYVVTWSSYQDGSGMGIYAQRYDASGIPQGGEVRINSTTINDQNEPAVVALSSGGYVVTWTAGYAGVRSVYSQRFDANGVAVGGETRVNTNDAGDQLQSALAALTGGGYVVSWSSEYQDGSDYGIYAQRFAADGSSLNMLTLTGGAGADVLRMSSADDSVQLIGGGGNDTLRGGAANDLLAGGAGQDQFEFAASGNGLDTISDWQAGDKLVIDGASLTGPVTSGAGATVGAGRVELQSAAGSTWLYIGTDAAPGADVAVKLSGTWSPAQFRISGNQIIGNNAPSGSVTMSGEARQGQTLTAANTLADADGKGAVTYQWQASTDGSVWSAIAAGSANTLVLTGSEVGKQVRVLASYTDGLGMQESVASQVAVVKAPIAQLTYSDGTFSSSDWLITRYVVNGASVNWAVQPTGGNPGADLWIQTAAPSYYPYYSVANGFVRNTAFTYNPGVQGEISSIRYEFDVKDGSSTHQGLGVALWQNDTMYYAYPVNRTYSYNWSHVAVTLNGTSFNGIQPDFSAAGAPIQFGFFVANSGNATGSAYYDNFSVTITHDSANQPPSVSHAIADQAAAEDTPFSYTVPADTFADPNAGDVLSYAATLANGAPLPAWLSFDPVSRTFSGTPGNGDVGTLSIKVTATDAGETSVVDVFELAVANTNDAPSGGVSIGGTPAQGQTLTASSTLADADGMGAIGWQWLRDGSPIQGATNAGYTLTQADVGTRISVRANYTDGFGAGESVASAVTVAIENVNDAPVGMADFAELMADAGTGMIIDVLHNDTDIDVGDSKSIVSLDTAGTLGGAAIVDGAVVYEPGTAFQSLAAGDTAVDYLRYTMRDAAGAQSSASVFVTVRGVNDAPVATGDAAAAQEDGGAVIVRVLENDSDVDHGDRMSLAGVDAGETIGAVSMQADGTISYDPGGHFQFLAEGEMATDSFTYLIRDRDGLTSSATVAVTVTGTNDAPVVAHPYAGVVVALQGQPFSVSINPAMFWDVDDDVLALSASLQDGSPLPQWLSFDPGTFTLSGLPSGVEDELVLQIAATDSHGARAADSVVLTVGRVLQGGNGINVLTGGRGNDIISGGNAADILSGGAGDDRIAGGRGDDVLTGGAGSDAFVLTAAGGADRVTDFAVGVDRLELSGVTFKKLSFADVDLNGSLDAVVQLSNGSVTLLGVSAVSDAAELFG